MPKQLYHSKKVKFEREFNQLFKISFFFLIFGFLSAVAIIYYGDHLNSQINRNKKFSSEIKTIKEKGTDLTQLKSLVKRSKLLSTDYKNQLLNTIEEVSHKPPEDTSKAFISSLKAKETSLQKELEALNVRKASFVSTKYAALFGLIGLALLSLYLLLKKRTEKIKSEFKSGIDRELKNIQELKETSKAKDLFLANMSHEIRTPLSAIIGFSDLISNENTNKADVIKYGTLVKKNGMHLQGLIEDLFDLSKLHSNNLEINYEKVNLLHFLLELRETYAHVASHKTVWIDFEIRDEIPLWIQTDKLRIKQILSNMINNAIKFTPANGCVHIIVNMSPENKSICFNIHDDGIGIPKSKQNFIYDKFHQVDSKHTRSFGGAGLGLSISKNLTGLLQGDLELVWSEPNMGSHFRLSLPHKSCKKETFTQQNFDSEKSFIEDDTSDAVVQNIEDYDLNKMNVLLAEDAKENQILFKIYLESAGATITAVDNGKDAVKKAFEENYDLILMDIQMPELDGYQALHTLRERGYKGKVIALTAHALKGDKNKVLQAGFDDYMSKPIQKDKLLEKVRVHGTHQKISLSSYNL